MDQLPSKNESAPFKLPEVQVESEESTQSFEAASKNITEHSKAKAIERNLTSNPLSNATSTQSANPLMIDPAVLGDPAKTSQPTSSPTKIAVTDSLPANDNDLIEKAWVVKAKAIVEDTKNDPYEQSNEIKKIRNDYLSKRFKTNVKIDKE